jgi:hypothetical protein
MVIRWDILIKIQVMCHQKIFRVKVGLLVIIRQIYQLFIAIFSPIMHNTLSFIDNLIEFVLIFWTAHPQLRQPIFIHKNFWACI